MKKVFLLLAVCIVVSFVISGLAFAMEKMDKPMKKPGEPSGAALWTQMKKADYIKKWQMWPGQSAFYPGKEPHGMLLTTYVNQPALRAIVEMQGKMPCGSIIVKENYMPDKKLAALTVMYKVKGYNPEGGDWFWVKYSPNGKVDAEERLICASSVMLRQRAMIIFLRAS